MMDIPRIINMNNIQYLTWIYVMDIHDDFSVLEDDYAEEGGVHG